MDLREVFSIALSSIRANRLRAILTVLGVVVGVFSIIVIMTIITMMQNTIESGVSFLSKNTFQIQKWPAIHTGGPGSFSKYQKRKNITIEEYYRLQRALGGAKYVGAEQGIGGRVVRFGAEKTNPNIYLVGVTVDAFRTRNVTIASGRELRAADDEMSENVCVLGNDLITGLFLNVNPLGKTIRVDGRELKVIGTLEPTPKFFGQSEDNFLVIPLSTYQSMYGKHRRSLDITVMTHTKEDYNTIIEAATGYFRAIRKLAPGEENNFDIFSNESLLVQINDITSGVRIGAMVISFISLLAAGVGIMNIMLVSVTERTREIGIRKSVGATRRSILLQFMAEAIVLCLIGGVLGIIGGVAVGNIAGSLINAELAIPYLWILIGLGMCVLVGVVFGTYPAVKAANLDPIEALRYE